jgi:rhodanese-related sulfurtransferase
MNTQVSVDEFRRLMNQSDAVLLDIREAAELEMFGRINTNQIHIALSTAAAIMSSKDCLM